jgi:hypothetical protein
MSEHYINAVEDYLIDGLQFKMPPGGSYVISRKNCTFYPAGSAIYSASNGTKLIRINLSSSTEWLDPQTVRLSFRLNNKDAAVGHQLRTIGGPYSFFSRVRLLAGGTMVEDIMDYSRVHNMFSELSGDNAKRNEDIEGFGVNASDITTYSINSIPGIKPGSSKTVCTKLLCGLFNQIKYLPMQYIQLCLEIELDSNPTAAIIKGVEVGGGTYTVENTSTDWTIDDVKILADTVILDSSLQNSYTSHLLEGKSLPINYTTFVSQSHIMTQQPNYSVNIVRSFTRLKSIFINFYADATNDAQTDGVNIKAEAGDNTANLNADFVLKTWNRFYNPQSRLAVNDRYSSINELEWHISVGSLTFPVFPCSSTAQSLYRLKQALGITNSSFHAMNLTYAKYVNNTFILGLDLEKICEVGFTGINTKANDLITISTKWNGVLNNVLPLKMYAVLCADQILEIRDGGCTVFD